MEFQNVAAQIDALAEEYQQLWVDFCNLESPTDDKAGVDRASRLLANRARALGWTVEVHPQSVSGDCVFLLANTDVDAPAVVLSGHVDTVHPVGSFGTPATHIADGKIYGPGVLDCKGGIVAAFLAMDALTRCGYRKRPLYLLLQSDEENSSITSQKQTVRAMIEASRGCVAFLNCEGRRPGALVLQRKGILRYDLRITGRAAHSSHCYEGASAICEAAHKILALEQWKDPDGITCNCGVISGGTVANSVAEECALVADVRFATEAQRKEVERRVAEIAAHSTVKGTTCQLSIRSQRVPMEDCEKNRALFARIAAALEKHGFPVPVPRGSNGGSDAADMTAAGIPTVDSIGVEGGLLHSVREFAYLSSLAQSAKELAAIAWEL